MRGGEGADIFVFGVTSAPAADGLDAGAAPSERDVVTDFAQGEDLLRLEGIGAEAVTWRIWGTSDTLVTLTAPNGAEGWVILTGVTALTEADFVFA